MRICAPTEAAAKERKLLIELKMLEGRGPNEFYSRLISQYDVCQNTSKCDVSLQTVADTFVLGLPSELRRHLIITTCGDTSVGVKINGR